MENTTNKPVRIVTVSTSDIPEDLAKAYNIKIIPEYVRFGESLYRDRVEMGVDAFLQEIQHNPNFPKTTPPTPSDYQAVFTRILDEGYDVLYIGLSGKISSGLKLAQIARTNLSEERIGLLDSASLSMGLGLIVLELAKRARQGDTLSELTEKGEALKKGHHGLFMVANLDFLKRGGRLSGTQAFVGGLLQVKPLLQVVGGEISVKEKIRGQRERAMHHMTDLLLEGRQENSLWAVVHIGCSEDAESISKWVNEAIGEMPIQAPCGVVVGTHCGPGGLGIFRLDL